MIILVKHCDQLCSVSPPLTTRQRHMAIQPIRLPLHTDGFLLQMHKHKHCPTQSHRSTQLPQSSRLPLCHSRRDIQPEQHSEPNISITSVSFEQFAVACKLSVSCSTGYVRQSSAGKFDKYCVSSVKAFSIPDYLKFFGNHWGRLPFLTVGKQKVFFEMWAPFFPTLTLSLTNICFHVQQPFARRSDLYRISI